MLHDRVTNEHKLPHLGFAAPGVTERLTEQLRDLPADAPGKLRKAVRVFKRILYAADNVRPI